MCGIAGIVGLADRNVIEAMIEVQAHRGPDDRGIFVDDAHQVALGNCRLSILDLSSAGHMPLRFSNERLWITHNGEVYNFRLLRAELARKGYVFTSGTDTEVILTAYVEWGAECLSRLRGMFAFAIYDGRERDGRERLFLARDRFGIKPLYWAQIGGVFLFASELKGLLASGLINRRLDHQAIWDYLSLGSVPPPRTMLVGVRALPPGHYMVVQQGKVRIEQYWDLYKPPEQSNPLASLTLSEAALELRRLLEEATHLHMLADVPVGAFLSGGVDSTAIVGLMSRQVSRSLKTYSIGFEGAGKRFSELRWARIAAERFGTEHTEVIVTGEDVKLEFDRLIAAIDQPSVDGVNSYFVSKAARTGVTVALSGLGGDEFFAGYPQFRWFAWAEHLAPTGSPTLALLSPALAILPGRWRVPLRFLAARPLERHSSVRRIFTEREKRSLAPSLLDGENTLQPTSRFYAPLLHPEWDGVTQTTYVEARGYMAHTLLRDTDVMSMAHSLEVRVPFLDHVVAEFAFRLPGCFKLNGADTKIVLVRALSDLLPQAIMKRRKMGFQFPMRDWLAGPLRNRVHEVLCSRQAAYLFDQQRLFKVQTDVFEGKRSYIHLWLPTVLVAWAQLYGCSL